MRKINEYERSFCCFFWQKNGSPGFDSHRSEAEVRCLLFLIFFDKKMAPPARLELATSKLTASCSTIELQGNNSIIAYFSKMW